MKDNTDESGRCEAHRSPAPSRWPCASSRPHSQKLSLWCPSELLSCGREEPWRTSLTCCRPSSVCRTSSAGKRQHLHSFKLHLRLSDSSLRLYDRIRQSEFTSTLMPPPIRKNDAQPWELRLQHGVGNIRNVRVMLFHLFCCLFTSSLTLFSGFTSMRKITDTIFNVRGENWRYKC